MQLILLHGEPEKRYLKCCQAPSASFSDTSSFMSAFSRLKLLSGLPHLLDDCQSLDCCYNARKEWFNNRSNKADDFLYHEKLWSQLIECWATRKLLILNRPNRPDADVTKLLPEQGQIPWACLPTTVWEAEDLIPEAGIVFHLVRFHFFPLFCWYVLHSDRCIITSISLSLDKSRMVTMKTLSSELARIRMAHSTSTVAISSSIRVSIKQGTNHRNLAPIVPGETRSTCWTP